MNAGARFQAEFMIRQNIAEIEAFADVFRERIISAFSDLHGDAEKAMDREMAQLNSAGFLIDPGEAAERAWAAGVDYYVAVDAVRQGVLNLMVAGLYHLLEQQAAYSLETALPQTAAPLNQEYALPRLAAMMLTQGIEIRKLPSWPTIEELGLIANTVKHGGGRSADRLRASKPELFKSVVDDAIFPLLRADLPIRPLVGDGLTLTPEHFQRYADAVKIFWEEIIAAMLPIMRPDLAGTKP